MCSTSPCASMSITVEQFVEVCSSSRASDAACGIYTSYSLNVLAQDCWRKFVPMQSTCIRTDTAGSHRYGQSLPSFVLIKTLKLLAPSSINPIALCSLIPGPSGLTLRLSHSLSPYVSVSVCDCLWWMEEAKEERVECETLHHWDQWGEQKRQREQGRQRLKEECKRREAGV